MQVELRGKSLAGFTAATLLFMTVSTAHAGTYTVQSCSYYGNTAPTFQPASTAAHLSLANDCLVNSGQGNRSLEINQVINPVLNGYGASWAATTPSPAIMIVNAYTPVNTVLVECTLRIDGFKAGYFWGDHGSNYGTQPIAYINGCGSGNIGYGDGISRNMTPSRYFGWTVSCSFQTSCRANSSGGAVLGVNGIQLQVLENTGPNLLATPSSNLWYANGWVRGVWPLTLAANDPSGVCSMGALFDNRIVSGWTDPNRDPSSWTQCHGSQLPAQLDTTQVPDGHHSLTYWAVNAAGVSSGPSRSDAGGNPVMIDNSPVGLTLSGPSDVAGSGSTQYLTASATAGPSGVGGIQCATDGSPYQWTPGASAQIPVAGLGSHRIVCYAQNRAYDPYGHPTTSPTQSLSMSIRQPTALAISFARIADEFRCAPVHERIKVPVGWRHVRRHHKLVRVRVPPHFKTVRVIRCHARTVHVRVPVWVTVTEHGKRVRVRRTRTRRVLVPPHLVSSSSERVPFGHGTTVSGWLGTTGLTALGGHAVQVLTAPDNGHGAFKPAAVVTTSAAGFWTAHLPPGPSRLVEAVYAGGSVTEPSSSSQVHLVVPASVRLHVRPAATRWGHTIYISGRVEGGYLPAAGELIVLRIGWRGGSAEIGHLYTAANGRFGAPYTFLRGNGTEVYRLWAATARESDYPFAPARSRRIAVIVGPG